MNNKQKRPAINYTMCWLCKFQIGSKTEEVVFMTDDFDTVLKEYARMQTETPNTPVIFVDHKLVGKGRMLLSEDMMVLPQDVPMEAPINPVINADEANAHPGRVRNMANDGRLDNANTPWMRGHNKDVAARMLREPDPSKV